MRLGRTRTESERRLGVNRQILGSEFRLSNYAEYAPVEARLNMYGMAVVF